jgi:hypothetical protein
VAEFAKFLDELKEFFNALEIDKLLQALITTLEENHYEHIANLSDMCSQFIQDKATVPLPILRCVKSLTAIRKALVDIKRMKMGNDLSIYGYGWTADFQLEDYLFVLLGEFIDAAPEELKVKIVMTHRRTTKSWMGTCT